MKKVFFALLMISSTYAQAEAVRVAAIDYGPYAFYKGEGIDGVGVALVREMTKRTGIETRDMQITVGRAGEIAKSQVTIFPMLARNSDREKQYQWIGLLKEDKYCFVTLKSKPAVQNMDEAKKLKSIGVNQGGANETILTKAGFKNLEPSLGNSGTVRKLFAGKMDAWFSTYVTYAYSIKSGKENPDQVVCTGEYSPTEYWIAASSQMPKDQFETLKAAYQAVKTEGMIEKQFDLFK